MDMEWLNGLGGWAERSGGIKMAKAWGELVALMRMVRQGVIEIT